MTRMKAQMLSFQLWSPEHLKDPPGLQTSLLIMTRDPDVVYAEEEHTACRWRIFSMSHEAFTQPERRVTDWWIPNALLFLLTHTGA